MAQRNDASRNAGGPAATHHGLQAQVIGHHAHVQQLLLPFAERAGVLRRVVVVLVDEGIPAGPCALDKQQVRWTTAARKSSCSWLSRPSTVWTIERPPCLKSQTESWFIGDISVHVRMSRSPMRYSLPVRRICGVRPTVRMSLRDKIGDAYDVT